MLKKSLAKISLVSVGNIINALLGLAFLAAVAKSLDLNSFGIYAFTTTLLVSISKLIDFGTNSVFVAKSVTTGSYKFNNLFVSLKILLTLISLPVILLILVFSNIRNWEILSIILLGIIGYGINYTLYAFFQRDQKYLLLVVLNTLPALIKGLFAILIFSKIFIPNLTTSTTIFSLSIFTSLILFYHLKKEDKTFDFTIDGLKQFSQEAYPGGISQMVYESWASVSNIIAKYAKGFADVGIFSLASKLSRFFALIALSIFAVLLPKNAARKKDNLSYDLKETIIISVLIVAVSIACIPFAEIAVKFLFGTKFTASIDILSILLISAGLSSIHTFIENFFFVESKTQYLMWINLGKLMLFVSLSVLLVPQYALYGLAIADLVSSSTAVIATFLSVKKAMSL